MIRWLAFRTMDRVLGVVEAPDLNRARLEAWARWGSSVERVQSEPSWVVAKKERAPPPLRRPVDEDDAA